MSAVMNRRDATLRRAIRFERPDYIPMAFSVNAACWRHYDPDALQGLMESHRFLFPEFKRQKKIKLVYGATQQQNVPFTDAWGCVWETAEDGITGSVRQHPLTDWADFEGYRPPDPNRTNGVTPVDWEAVRSRVERARGNGQFIAGSLPHGHTFLRLQDIRGYENLLFDMADDDPRVHRLIEMVSDFNHAIVMRWLELAPDMMMYPEDLGMQVGPMLSPDGFRRFIKPVYRRIMQPARERGCIVHMHSDGDIRALVDDLLEDGVEVFNLQDLVNGIDWIAGRLAGRVCVDLDIDRQRITPHGTPAQIDSLIREEVEKIGSREGGLMMIYGLYPGVPLANVKALMDAMERYAGYYA